MIILICDDKIDEATALEAVIQNSGFNANVIFFNNGSDAFSYIQSGAKVDLCFLDILMPEMNGDVLAVRLRENGFHGGIVFLTTSNEYATQSYKVGALSYLLKPLDAASITNILQMAEDIRKTTDVAGIPIVTRNMSRFLLFHEISYIEVIQHKVYFRLTDGSEIEFRTTLKELLEKLLCDGRFAQCHRSFVVNMNDVSYIKDNDIILRRGKKIPISKSFLNFNKQYLNWVFGGDMN